MKSIGSATPDPTRDEWSITRFARARAWFESVYALPHDERARRLAQLRELDGDLAGVVEDLVRSAPPEDNRPDHSRTDASTSDSSRWVPALVDWRGESARRSIEFPKIAGYHVVSAIGSGAHGDVFMAQQVNPPRTVAIKLLRSPPSESRARARFLREAEILARLSHPGVVPIHSVGATADDCPYLVMEFVPGTRLDQHVHERQATLQQRLRLMIQVCDAIGHAHHAGILHLDLKPANIMVRPPDDTEVEPRVQVVDFGIARSTSGSLGASSEPRLAGTLPYMSPEHVSGDLSSFCETSDVFCLGVVTYELVTGRLPHGDVDDFPGAIVDRIRRVSPVPPNRLKRSVGEDLSRVIRKALSKEPEDRYPTTAALARDLRNVLDGRPVSARSPSVALRLTRWARRNPATALTGALLLGSAWLWQHQRARSNRLERIRVAREHLVAAERDLSGITARASMLGPSNLAEFDQLRALDEARVDLQSRYTALERDWRLLRQDVFSSTASATSTEPHFAALLDALSPDHQAAAHASMWSQLTRRIAEARAYRDCADQTAYARESLTTMLADPTHSSEFGESMLLIPETLVPLGRNECTGLWEFWHVPSGPRPSDRDDGNFSVCDGAGLVFVLIPPGVHCVGRQRNDPRRPHYDDHARSQEEDTRDVVLPAYLISKYELTVSQWEHLSRGDPVHRAADPSRSNLPIVGASAAALEEVLSAHGLALPTETQWETAARSGCDTPWWFGHDRMMLPRYGNVADRSYDRGHTSGDDGADTDIDDGHATVAPVTFTSANEWGLVGVVGNAGEMCHADFHRLQYFDVVSSEPRPGTDPAFALRGGSYQLPGDQSRAAHRIPLSGTELRPDVGVRPTATLLSAAGTRRRDTLAVESDRPPLLPRSDTADTTSLGSILLKQAVDRRWGTALAAIRDTPAYEGLRILPDLDLVPAGPDATSGLWEFFLLAPKPSVAQAAHIVAWIRAGCPARYSPDLIRLVLIPAKADQAPFLIGKYEMSQRHWISLRQSNPTAFPQNMVVRVGGDTREYRHDDRHPVDNIAFAEVAGALQEFGLSVPTLSQWRTAAGTQQYSREESISQHIRWKRANLATIEIEQEPIASWTTRGPAPPDGYLFHAPTGSFAPNCHGLYDLIGNVWEWATSDALPAQPVLLGGSYRTTARTALDTYAVATPEYSGADVGFRVARPVQRRKE